MCWQFDGNNRLDQAAGFVGRVDDAASALRVADGADLAHVELVEEDACGIAILANHIVGSVENRLPCASSLIFGCYDHEAPRRKMPEEVIHSSRRAICAVSPSNDRVQEAAGAKIRRIVEIEPIAEGVAAKITRLHRHAPGTCSVIF